MKVIFFPAFSFLYSFLEKWLQNQASKGLILADRKWWFWYFKKRNPSNRSYFLWVRRSRGKDCLDLAIAVRQLYGKNNLVMFNNYLTQPSITEVVAKKVNDDLTYYRQKRNYICKKIATEYFLFTLAMAIISVITNVKEVLFIITAFIFGVNWFFNVIQCLICNRIKKSNKVDD